MARIVVEIPDIPGESDLEGYDKHLDAVAIRETLEIPVSKARGGAVGMGASSGAHSDIMLTRVRDRGSPKLAEACSAGTLLGNMIIRLCRSVEGGTDVYMTYTLGNAYVSRYEVDTADEHGLAYMPHFGSPGKPLAPSAYGIASLLDAPLPDKARQSPRPMMAQPRGVAGTKDLERVWFNAVTVHWHYTGNDQNITGGWHIRKDRSLV